MAKVLLVDTNFSSAPIYRELMDMDHEVHVVGDNPEDYLAKQAARYWPINYADTEALQALVAQEHFDAVVPGCTDRSYESCSQLSGRHRAGIDDHHNSQILNNKRLFKERALQLGLPVPCVQTADWAALRWPLIVKPVDAFSGKGISVLNTPDAAALSTAIDLAREASPSKQFLIEDYIEGQLYSHSAFLRNHEVVQDFIVREDRTANPFVVDTSMVDYNFPPDLREQLRQCVRALSHDLRLTDGLIHTQFIRTESGFWLIECTRRCPGDLYSQLIELTTGFPYARAYALPFLADAACPQAEKTAPRPILRHTVSVPEPSALGHLHFLKELAIERWIPLALAGDRLEASPKSRLGILFCRTRTMEELNDLYQLTLERKLYRIVI